MIDFEEYIRQDDASKKEKAQAWQTAIGLQAVDALQTSEYLKDTAQKHIEGDITMDEVQQLISNYYAKSSSREAVENNEEADKTSANIAKLLSEQTFSFSFEGLASIHRHIFQGVFPHAGKIRDYNITKKEWSLDGETVLYAAAGDIKRIVEYDLEQEKQFSYVNLNANAAVSHIARFTSNLWQVHPFCEGNTRTTAVFVIKYLRAMGFSVDNTLFADNSWYFRNALVRANYQNFQKKIDCDFSFIEKFFRNLLLGEQNELKNRYTHVAMLSKSAKVQDSKCKNCTLEEVALLQCIKRNPQITQKQMAEEIGKSERTVKTLTVNLTTKGFIRRLNGKRNGYWEILIDEIDN